MDFPWHPTLVFLSSDRLSVLKLRDLTAEFGWSATISEMAALNYGMRNNGES